MGKVTIAELEAVAAVARHGGFRAAARELGVSSSGLSHAIAGLEDRLSLRLFNRTTRSVVLTAAGEQFVQEIAPALAVIEGAIENAGEYLTQPSGTLRLNMALGTARFVLKPLVIEYLRRYPLMQIEVATEDELVDVVGRGFDAGVRMDDLVPPDMIAVPIMSSVDQVIVASPEYLQRRPLPVTPQDLLEHECVRARMASGGIYRWQFAKADNHFTLDVPGRLVLDDSGLMLDAALRGMGFAYLPERTVAQHLSAGRLKKVLESWMPSEPGLSLYYPGRRHVPRKLRAFIELVRERARPEDRE